MLLLLQCLRVLQLRLNYTSSLAVTSSAPCTPCLAVAVAAAASVLIDLLTWRHSLGVLVWQLILVCWSLLFERDIVWKVKGTQNSALRVHACHAFQRPGSTQGREAAGPRTHTGGQWSHVQGGSRQYKGSMQVANRREDELTCYFRAELDGEVVVSPLAVTECSDRMQGLAKRRGRRWETIQGRVQGGDKDGTYVHGRGEVGVRSGSYVVQVIHNSRVWGLYAWHAIAKARTKPVFTSACCPVIACGLARS